MANINRWQIGGIFRVKKVPEEQDESMLFVCRVGRKKSIKKGRSS